MPRQRHRSDGIVVGDYLRRRWVNRRFGLGPARIRAKPGRQAAHHRAGKRGLCVRSQPRDSLGAGKLPHVPGRRRLLGAALLRAGTRCGAPHRCADRGVGPLVLQQPAQTPAASAARHPPFRPVRLRRPGVLVETQPRRLPHELSDVGLEQAVPRLVRARGGLSLRGRHPAFGGHRVRVPRACGRRAHRDGGRAAHQLSRDARRFRHGHEGPPCVRFRACHSFLPQLSGRNGAP